MRNIFCLVLLFISTVFSCYSQESALPELQQRYVYRGMSNPLSIEQSSSSCNVVLIGFRCSIVKHGQFYSLTPSTDTDTVEVILTCSEDRSVSKRYKLAVIDMPEPKVYWGKSQEGETIDLNAKTIDYSFTDPGETKFEDFLVTGCEIFVEGYSKIKFAGDKIPDEILKRLGGMQDPMNEKIIHVVVHYSQSNGLTGSVSVIFLL